MDKDVRNMKTICGLLHNMKREWLSQDPNIDGLIDTAERVYHKMKDENER